MPDPVQPGIVPKVVLRATQYAHLPAHVPAMMTNTAGLTGGAVHELVPAVNGALKATYNQLGPRHGAGILNKLFDRIDKASASSQAKAATSAEVFWKPFSIGVEQVGQSFANIGAGFYAKRAGFENADAKTLAEITHARKGWPVPPPKEEPKAEEPKPTDNPDAPKPTDTPDAPKPAEGGEPTPAPAATGDEGAPTPAPAQPDGSGAPAPAPADGGPTPTPVPEGQPAPTPGPEGGGPQPQPQPTA